MIFYLNPIFLPVDSSSENIMFPSPSKSDGSPHQGIISDTKGRATAKLKKKPKGITKSYVKPKGLYLSGEEIMNYNSLQTCRVITLQMV